MRRIIAAIRMALAALAQITWTMVREGGRWVLRAVSIAPPPEPATAAEALHSEIEDARRDAELQDRPITQGETIRRYAAARAYDCDLPLIDEVDELVQRWLGRLNNAECRVVLGISDRNLLKHFDYRDEYWIPGVRTLTGVLPADRPAARDGRSGAGGQKNKPVDVAAQAAADAEMIRDTLQNLLTPSPGMRMR